MQRITVGRPQHRPAAGGQHDAGLPGKLRDDLGFDLAESSFALVREIVADRHADALLDLAVAVGEAQAQLPREVAPDGGLAAARHAHQGQAQGLRQFGHADGAAPRTTVTDTVVPVPLGERKVTKMTPELTVASVKL